MSCKPLLTGTLPLSSAHPVGQLTREAPEEISCVDSMQKPRENFSGNPAGAKRSLCSKSGISKGRFHRILFVCGASSQA